MVLCGWFEAKEMPRNTQLRCFQCCTRNAKRAWGAPSAAPAIENEPEMLQVLHLPRKTNLRCSKCCTCHAKRAWCSKCCTCHTKAATSIVLTCRRTFADLSGGAASAAPATENEPGMLQVLRLPRKTSRSCSKCCTCHAKAAGVLVLTCRRTSSDFWGAAASAAPATQNVPEVLQVLQRLASTICTCHAKWHWGAASAASAAPATQNEPEVLQVLHLPRKSSRRPYYSLVAGHLWRCSEGCTCHGKRAGNAASASPATQNEPEVLQVLHLPRKAASVHSTRLLPDFHRPLWRCCKFFSCQAKRAWGAPSAAHAAQKAAASIIHSTHLSPDFRGPLWRCSECCTCHAKWHWGAASAASAAQKRRRP